MTNVLNKPQTVQKVSAALACIFVYIFCSAFWVPACVQEIAPHIMNFEQYRVKLVLDSDALAAADANVRGKVNLAEATQSNCVVVMSNCMD